MNRTPLMSAGRVVRLTHLLPNFAPSILMLALSGVFLFGANGAQAAQSLPADCEAVGGVLVDGVCSFGDGAQEESVVVSVNDDWTLTEGDLAITGGVVVAANGITNFVTGSGKTGSFANEGSGAITIQGGPVDNTSGLYVFANNGGTGSFVNAGSGSIRILAHESDFSHGMYAVANGSGSSAEFLNTGKGEILIQGGSGEEADALEYFASEGGEVRVANTGGGRIVIRGGSGRLSYGVGNGAMSDGSTLTIVNGAGGEMIFEAGSGVAASGIGYLAYWSGASGTIINEEGATMSIIGTSNASGVSVFAGTDGAHGSLENAGTLNINAYGIYVFKESWIHSAEVEFINRATGTVNAEAEQIFERRENTETTPIDIGVLVPADGTWTSENANVEGFETSETTVTWSMKSHWANYSVWEDGGSLVFTDVMEGTLAAQEIEKLFRDRFGEGTNLTFKGENDDASTDMAPKFNVAIANDLIAQGYAGAVVTNLDLDLSTEDGTRPTLAVGESGTGALTDSIGFRRIVGASDVNVRGGKTLTLIGTVEGDELVEGGGTIGLDNGSLHLGVDAGTEETSGRLSDVSIANESKVKAENGWFRLDSLRGAGDVSVAGNGRVRVTDMKVDGTVKNEGTLSAAALTVSGTLASSKVLKADGTITIDSASTLVADGIVAADALDVKGTMIRGKEANVYLGAAALDTMREDHPEAAAELDRLEGKAEASTLSVLQRIMAKSAMVPSEDSANPDQGKVSDEPAPAVLLTNSRRPVAPVLPKDAQVFAAFDAVNRIATDIERGTDPDGHGLWVKLQTNESEFDARAGTKFEIDSDGAVIGAEAKLNPSWKVGGAVSYLDGEIDSGLTKNDWKSYGLHAYAQFKEGAFGVKGTAGWLRGTTETAEDYDADVWHAGVRAEYDLVKGTAMTFTPFLGARLMSGSFDGMASQTAFSLPIGVALSGTLTTAGWTIVPSFEVAYVRNMGDTEADDVRFLPKDALKGALSVKATKGVWTGELSYRGATGGRDYEGRAFMAKIGVSF